MQTTKPSAIFLATLLAACALQVRGAYPGNSNFRNVSVSYAETNRTDWVTNVTTMIGTARNPGYATPIDWSVAQSLAPGVDHIPVILTTDGGWPRQMVCHMLRINLDTPGLRFTGTDRCPEGWGEDMPEPEAQKADGTYHKKRTVRERTSDFLARNRGSKSKGGKERDARVAFNLAAWLPWTSPTTNLWAAPYSPLYSDGVSVSFAALGGVANANNEPVPQSMIVVYKDGTAGIINSIDENRAKKVWFCAPAFVAEIVSAGVVPPHGDTGVDPRTAMGISQDNKKIYFFFCDGRRDGWSKGCDFPSLSTLLQAMGSYYAINLDGGGSSTFIHWNDSLGKPALLNRPSGSLRDNGSNAAIYYKSPDAMIGTWLYDDMDFLVQDIIDGEVPDGETTINVLADATFTAEHPGIPVGTAWTLSSTNNASIGWADGVAPQVAAGSTVGFRNIRLRTTALSVAAGGKAVLNGATGFTEISSADASCIAIAGPVPAGLRVACATATGVGDYFATSSLSLADAAVEAKKLICATDATLSAEAVAVDGGVKLKWNRIVTFGASSGRIVGTLDRGVVGVRVDDCAGDYLSGYKLKLTVTSEDGRRSATQAVDFTGPGLYSFNTVDASDPSICAAGFGYGYTVELVDTDGAKVPNTEVASGTMRVGIEKDWFLAQASDDSAVGGDWTTKPGIESGRYKVVEDSNGVFAANESKGGRVRYEAAVEFGECLTDSNAELLIGNDDSAAGSSPQGACFIVNGDDELCWHALVSENGAPAFKTLHGPAALNTPCKVVCEVDWSSSAALVRYSVAVGDGDETVLVDDEGASWFPSVSSANTAAGRVTASGTGFIDSLKGVFLQRELMKKRGSFLIK